MKSKIHRCNCRKTWLVQNRKMKTTVRTVLLNGKWTAELNPERRCNPKGFITTVSSEDIIFNPAVEVVEQFIKVKKLFYDKKNISFNVKQGEYLYFAEDGSCYLLKKANVVRAGE